MPNQTPSKYPTPWNVLAGGTAVLICDANDELLLVIEPAMRVDDQLQIAHSICAAVNGPRLKPFSFYRERYSGRIQTGRRWLEEFQDIASRDFEEIDPEEELRD